MMAVGRVNVGGGGYKAGDEIPIGQITNENAISLGLRHTTVNGTVSTMDVNENRSLYIGVSDNVHKINSDGLITHTKKNYMSNIKSLKVRPVALDLAYVNWKKIIKVDKDLNDIFEIITAWEPSSTHYMGSDVTVVGGIDNYQAAFYGYGNDGSELWRAPQNIVGNPSGVSTTSNRIYWLDDYKNLIKLNEIGESIWEHRLPYNGTYSSAVEGEGAYVYIPVSKNILKIDNNGNRLWSKSLNNSPAELLPYKNGSILLPITEERSIYRMDATGETEKFATSLADNVNYITISPSGTIAYVELGKYLTLLETESIILGDE